MVKNVRMFRSGHSPPCITARRGGCVIKKISRSHRSRRSRGGFPFCIHRKTTPASRSEDAARHFIDRSATPAMMQGGEYPLRNVRTFFSLVSFCLETTEFSEVGDGQRP